MLSCLFLAVRAERAARWASGARGAPLSYQATRSAPLVALSALACLCSRHPCSCRLRDGANRHRPGEGAWTGHYLFWLFSLFLSPRHPCPSGHRECEGSFSFVAASPNPSQSHLQRISATVPPAEGKRADQSIRRVFWPGPVTLDTCGRLHQPQRHGVARGTARSRPIVVRPSFIEGALPQTHTLLLLTINSIVHPQPNLLILRLQPLHFV